MTVQELDVEKAVTERYSQASRKVEGALCCPRDYSGKYLECIPKEVIERDYGCGNPENYLKSGERVLDLGSGTGKICFIASQIVGPQGKVIGVDMNDDMLGLARNAAGKVAEQIGYANVEFKKGKIQDLRLDYDRVDRLIRECPISDLETLNRFQRNAELIRKSEPMIPSDSIDAVVSNCVLNLVKTSDKKRLFQEIFRVLKKGGRAIISDIVADEAIPEKLKSDPELWSGCLSGAFQENEFIEQFIQEGFYGAAVVKRDQLPWQIVDGIEFRSVTIVAYKGKEGECWDYNEALIYRGPFKSVTDDDGNIFRRGERTAVCRKTFDIYSKDPYHSDFYQLTPLTPVNSTEAQPFSCEKKGMIRSPKDTKNGSKLHAQTTTSSGCC